ncbi:MAG: ATP-binding protein [Myxococcales bacterium]|nr:ATP-binding protein [Myxococcales bacterium]
MPRFAPITTAAHLPAADSAYERSTLDFKATSSPKPTFEQAKDVAAFANRFGGTILIGFEERGDGRVGVLKPLTESYAAGVKNAVSNAVRDRCRPSPTVDIDVIAVGEDQRVLAVNVSPFFGQPVGVVANDATKGECALRLSVSNADGHAISEAGGAADVFRAEISPNCRAPRGDSVVPNPLVAAPAVPRPLQEPEQRRHRRTSDDLGRRLHRGRGPQQSRLPVLPIAERRQDVHRANPSRGH